MQLIDTRILRGPNVFDRTQCFWAVIDLAELANLPPAAHPGLGDRLAAALPGFTAAATPEARQQALTEVATWAHLVGRTVAALLSEAEGHPAWLQVAPVKGRPGRFDVVCGYRSERVAEEAFHLAWETLSALARGEVVDAAEGLAELRDLATRQAIGPSTGAILDAAERRGIPIYRLTDEASLYQLGWGKHARRIRATVTSQTGQIACDIASDKQLTKTLLDEAGLPVPRGERVRSAEAAVAAARRLGGPVVVKPLDGNQGKGVSLNLTDPDQIREAYRLASAVRRWVLVERFIEGQDYRVLVVGDQVIACSHRLPAQVMGDGEASVGALVARENLNPLRGDGHLKPLTRIQLDEMADTVLARQALTRESVPAAGQVVHLKENANLSTGGTAEDMTDDIHPLNALACVRAAQQVGLDVAGIDVVCRDISRPLAEQDGALIEINAAPGIRMHQFPAKGQARDVGAAIVDALFPPGERTRIPVVAVTGTNGKTTTSLLVGQILQQAGFKTGVTTTEGIYIDGQPIKTGDCTGYWSARTLLGSPAVEAAVLETARGGIFKRGLAFDYCDVGVVLNVSDDHLGQHGAETLEDLARVKSLIARSAWNAAVLNAEDPRCVAMAEQRHPGAQVIYFSLDPRCPALLQHLDAGGRGVYYSRQALVLADGDHRWPLVGVEALPFTLGGRARHNVANALAAVAAAWALGVSEADIVAGLSRFGSTLAQNPGRLNLFRVGEFQVLLDYAHNPASYRQILATARSLTQGRLIGVVAVPGDRYDDKLQEIGGIVADACDVLVVREKSDRRGRKLGEGPAVILEGVKAAGFTMDLAHLVLDPAEAIPMALQLAAPGDLVLVACADEELVVQMAGLAEETLSPEDILNQLALRWLA